ncbi:hypothetical protein Tco_0806391 [Tanacetum coccineum]
MVVVRFHCPFVGLSGCHDGGGNRLTKTSLITHLRDCHCNGVAQAITRKYLSTNLAIFEEAEVTFKRMGIWLCGGCFKMHSLRSKCRHGKGSNFVSPPDCGDGVVRFVLYDIIKPHVPSSLEQLDHVYDLVQVQHGGFTLALLDSLFSKGLRTVKSIPPKCRLGFSRVLKEALDKVICTPDDISCWAMRETLAESSPLLSDVDEEYIDLGERNIKQCKRKICDGHYTAAVRVLSSFGVAPYNDATLEDLKTKHPFKPPPSLPHISIDHHHLVASPFVVLDKIKSFPRGTLGEYIASAPLTPLVKPGGGIRPIAVGTIWRRLVSKACGDDVGYSMLLVDFKNAFNLIDREVMLCEVRLRCPAISSWVEFLLHPLICKIRDSFRLSLHAWYLDDGTIVGDTVVAGKVLELIMEDGPGCGLHLNVDKIEVFWPKEDPRSRLAVAKTIGLMDVLPKINDPNAVVASSVLLRDFPGYTLLCATFPPPVIWRLAMEACHLTFFIWGLDVYSAGDVLNYAFLASRLQSAGLQTKLLRHTGIVSYGPIFDDALSVFNTSMETDLLSNPSEIAAPKLMKKMTYLYFTRVTKNAESTFSLSPQQMALWTSQKEDHTSDWLRTVPIFGLGQTMNACSRVFAGDIYGDHAVSCAGIIGIKHRHNVVRDTLVNICYRSGISTGKEVDIGLDGGRDKPLLPADMLLYSWDGGLDVCVDLTGSSPLTQTGMVDFVPGRAVIDAAQRKRAFGPPFVDALDVLNTELETGLLRIAPLAIIDRQLPFEYTIAKNQLMGWWYVKMALPVQNINHSAFRSMFEREKLSVYDAYNEVSCLILGSMTPELHRQFEHSSPYDIIRELKSMFEKQAGVEQFDLIQTFHACKQEEGKPVGPYVLKMKGYVEQLECLGYVLLQDISVGLILNGLTSDFAGFIRNYNMHNMGKTIGELHALLIEY